MRRITSTIAGLLLLTAAGPLAEPLLAQQVRFGGQVRPRWELKDPSPPTAQEAFVVMRSRLSAAVELPEHLGVFLQLQDVRLWGEDRLAPAAGSVTELHQAWLEIGNLIAPAVRARVGRQEIGLGSERLVGVADWTPRGRAFDAARVTWGAERRELDAFVARIADRSAARPLDVTLAGVHLTVPVTAAGTVGAYFLFDAARGAARTNQATFGGRLLLRPSGWLLEVEPAIQTGRRADRDVSAWMLRAHAGPVLAGGRARVAAAFEQYSGGDPADPRERAFDALYGTGHAFLGFADLFLNLPVHTGGRGVRDVGVRSTFTPVPGTDVIVNVHTFRAADDTGLPTARFGEELDVRLRHGVRTGLGLVAGWSHVWHGPALAEIGRLDRAMNFFYLMLNATF